MNKAVYVVILFVIISGIIQYNTEYKMPAKEIYYRDFMLELEGNTNSSKDELIEKEQRKYDQAFLEIERIDNLMADGKIDTASGETMKNEYQMIVSYYPQFKKILHKYEIAKKMDEVAVKLKTDGGKFDVGEGKFNFIDSKHKEEHD